MKAVARVSDLRQPLARAMLAVERRNTIPILSCLHLAVTGGHLAIRATNLDIEIATSAPLLSGEDGAMCLDAHRLAAVVRQLPADEQISIALVGERAQIDIGSGRFSMLALPARDFPDAVAAGPDAIKGESLGQTEIVAKDVQAICRRLLPFVSAEETRYYLNGICLHAQSGETVAAATDGHHLGLLRTPLAGDWLADRRIIVPRFAVRILAATLAGDAAVNVAYGSSWISFAAGDLTIRARLIDGTFPSYERVIPTGPAIELVADRAKLGATLGRLRAFWGGDPHRSTMLHSDGDRLALAGGNDDAAGILAAPIRFDGPVKPVTIAFNARYLRDVLGSAAGDELRISVRGDGHLIGFTDPEGSVFVVMPLRSNAAPRRIELPEGAVA